MNFPNNLLMTIFLVEELKKKWNYLRNMFNKSDLKLMKGEEKLTFYEN